MTRPEWEELVALYVDDALPEALQGRVEAHLALDPKAAQDAAALRQAASRLRQRPQELPAAWFVERALDGLLREHADATITTDTVINNAR